MSARKVHSGGWGRVTSLGLLVLLVSGVCATWAQQPAATKPAATRPGARGPSNGNAAYPTARDERLARIEAQLSELQKTIAELKKAPADEGSARLASAAVTPTPVPQTLSEAGIHLDSKWTSALSWRSIGPAGMGGRIVD